MIHPVLESAAHGELPPWAQASDGRRAHASRVAALLESWARSFGLPPGDVVRWRAAGMLHDAMRDADPDMLRPLARPWLADLPVDLEAHDVIDLFHGPALATRLREEGLTDPDVLRAVAWHTVGHGELDCLGRALYLADFLEPGRRHESEVSARRRERVPADPDGVLREVAAERIGRSLRHGRPLLAPTVDFWNGIVRG